MDGQPVEGATISFSPVDKSGTAAVGTTDASGVFKLTAIPDGAADQGTKAGEYLVGIIKHKSEPAVALSTDDPNYGKETRSSTEAPKIERIVPQKYENPATSGFKVTVKPGTNNGDDFKFNLKKE